MMSESHLTKTVVEELANVGELPDLAELEKSPNAAIQRALSRIKQTNLPSGPQAHQKHASHDRSGHSSGLW
jgi:hypothetical protein